MRVLQNGIVIGETHSPGGIVEVDVGDALRPREELTAVQEFDGEHSEPSPVPVIVQSIEALGPVSVTTGPRACEAALRVVGAVPGAEVSVSAGTTEIGRSRSQFGTALIQLTRPLRESESAVLIQEACGLRSDVNRTPPALAAAPLAAPMLRSEDLRACTPYVLVHGLTPGARVHIARSAGLGGTGFAEYPSDTFTLPESLQVGETVTITMDQPGCDVDPAIAEATVGDAVAPPPPLPRMPCSDSRLLLISEAIPGAEIEVFVDGAAVALPGTADRSEMRFGLPVEVKAPSRLSVRQRVCEEWSGLSPEIVLADVPSGGTVEVMQRPDLGIDYWPACATYAMVERHAGFSGDLQIWSTAQGPISDRLAAVTVFGEGAGRNFGIVEIAPALLADDEIWVRYFRCGADPADDSDHVAVRVIEELPPPVLGWPLVEDDNRLCLLLATSFGRYLDVDVDGTIETYPVADSDGVRGCVDLRRPLSAASRVRVRTTLCGLTSGWVDVVVHRRPHPPELISPLGPGQPIRPTFRWRSALSEARFGVRVTEHWLTTTAHEIELPSGSRLDHDSDYTWSVQATVDLHEAGYARGVSATSDPGRFRTVDAPPPPTRPVRFRFNFFEDSSVVTSLDLSASAWLLSTPEDRIVTVPFEPRRGGAPYEATLPISDALAARTGHWGCRVRVTYYVHDPARLVSGWFEAISPAAATWRGPVRSLFISARLSGHGANGLNLSGPTAIPD